MGVKETHRQRFTRSLQKNVLRDRALCDNVYENLLSDLVDMAFQQRLSMAAGCTLGNMSSDRNKKYSI